MQKLIDEIVILAEELSKEFFHHDAAANLYSVKLLIDEAIGRRMREMKKEQ